jgi:ribosome-associated protein
MIENTSLKVVAAAIDGVRDAMAEDIVALDVSNLTSFADAIVIATASSDRRARAIADSVKESVAAIGRKPLGIEGYEEGRWILIDLAYVVVHIFLREVREQYDLERLWSDAATIPIAAVGERTAVQ